MRRAGVECSSAVRRAEEVLDWGLDKLWPQTLRQAGCLIRMEDSLIDWTSGTCDRAHTLIDAADQLRNCCSRNARALIGERPVATVVACACGLGDFVDGLD
jgi:hypothetical protein